MHLNHSLFNEWAARAVANLRRQIKVLRGAAAAVQVAVLQECQLDSFRSGSTILGDLTTLLQAAFQVILSLTHDQVQDYESGVRC